MKSRGKNSGRRGKRVCRAAERLAHKKEKEAQYLREEKEECDGYLARILPRMKRLCALSEVGLVTLPSDPDDQDARYRRMRYYSVEGVRDQEYYGPTLPWESFSNLVLKEIAKIKKFEIVKPKNVMLVLAEAAKGLHDEL